MDDTDGGRDERGADGGALTWADLFERAAAYGADESAVREALARRRGEGDD